VGVSVDRHILTLSTACKPSVIHPVSSCRKIISFLALRVPQKRFQTNYSSHKKVPAKCLQFPFTQYEFDKFADDVKFVVNKSLITIYVMKERVTIMCFCSCYIFFGNYDYIWLNYSTFVPLLPYFHSNFIHSLSYSVLQKHECSNWHVHENF
jgi:hypothetical protein